MTAKYEQAKDGDPGTTDQIFAHATAGALLATEAFPSRKAGSSTNLDEQTHNYIGAATDVGNGMIHEVMNNQGQLMLTFVESAAAGAAMRFAPPIVRNGALGLGAVYGAYELTTHAPGWRNDASTVINESSHTPEELARAHVGLEHIGGGFVELSAGFQGFRRGMYAPEYYGVARSVYSDYSAGALKANEFLPAWQTRLATAKQAVDWSANPPWMQQSADALKSKFAGVRNWHKPDSVGSETEGEYASAPSPDTMARYREAMSGNVKAAAPLRTFSGIKDGEPFTITEQPDHFA
jgi:hypothetical protein